METRIPVLLQMTLLLAISVSLFFVWYAVVENSLAQLEN